MNNDDLILNHFSSDEFGPTDQRERDWFSQMAPDLLTRLDVLRELWGRPIRVSDHRLALGRNLGPGKDSDHNVDERGRVEAADVFPAGMNTPEDAEQLRELAQTAGFGAIGVYPHWLSPGLHLGIRDGHGGRDTMATWGALQRDGKQVYVSWDEALANWDEEEA